MTKEPYLSGLPGGSFSVVALCSGGMDSVTSATLASKLMVERGTPKSHERYKLLFARWGQAPHRQELECVRALAERLAWKESCLEAIRLPDIASVHLNYKPYAYAAARNIILISVAASKAALMPQPAVIFTGITSVDVDYPDCQPKFLSSMNDVLRAGLDGDKDVRVLAPLLHHTKREIIRLGLSLGVPFEDTWSCYSDGIVPCGACASCKLRAKGFEAAQLADPALEGERHVW